MWQNQATLGFLYLVSCFVKTGVHRMLLSIYHLHRSGINPVVRVGVGEANHGSKED